jgi:DNA-binding LacI/PurR family transcriptional regulator
MSHLIELGHRRIGFISGPVTITTMAERRDGYLSAHKRHDLIVSPELMRFGYPRLADGYACAQELLQLSWPPTALFVANNLMALGALQAIQERGLSIPHGISLVSFSDMPWASLLQPPLTAIVQPDYELGQKAAELLLERFAQPDKPVSHVQLSLTLTVRASTGRPPEARSSA